MPTSVVTCNILQVSNDQKFQIVIGTLVIGAGSYVQGGLALDAVLDAMSGVHSGGKGPLFMTIQSASGSGYGYQRVMTFSPPTAGKLMISGAGATLSPPLEGAEIPASAIASAVTGDVIVFRAEFLRNAA
jgi:hypothetical protein